MERHPVVSREEWLAARKTHLLKEKELTHARDALNRERQALPWVAVAKDYRFDGPDGEVGLADLFQGRSQLLVQHFMLGPGWNEGCTGCSFQADHVDAAAQHFEHNDLSFAAVSRASWPEIEAYKRRMGWGFVWVSSFGSEFNHDFHVSFTEEERASGKIFYNFELTDQMHDELPGFSVFFKDEAGRIFHTYSSYARGNEEVLGAYMFLDMTPKGRNESRAMEWVRRHDSYDS